MLILIRVVTLRNVHNVGFLVERLIYNHTTNHVTSVYQYLLGDYMYVQGCQSIHCYFIQII